MVSLTLGPLAFALLLAAFVSNVSNSPKAHSALVPNSSPDLFHNSWFDGRKLPAAGGSRTSLQLQSPATGFKYLFDHIRLEADSSCDHEVMSKRNSATGYHKLRKAVLHCYTQQQDRNISTGDVPSEGLRSFWHHRGRTQYLFVSHTFVAWRFRPFARLYFFDRVSSQNRFHQFFEV